MKQYILAVSTLFVMASCGQNASQQENSGSSSASVEEKKESGSSYDSTRGEGKFKNVAISENLDKAMADAGEKVYNVKCASCHKLTDERLVGPGWKDVSVRRKAEWVMNFVTNTDEMISKDPAVQAQLEICLVRMPNQNLTDDDARSVYEYMRKNDGVK